MPRRCTTAACSIRAKSSIELAIDDFTSANGLTPQQAEPLLGRAVSYLALDKAKEAAADLDEAVQADPQNGQIWSDPRAGL